MEAKITRKQQVKNIIEWIDSLKRHKKTTGILGRLTESPHRYCCLGVACRIQKLSGVDFSDALEYRLVELMCLRDDMGSFDNRVIVTCPDKTTDCGTLVGGNDKAFTLDEDFTRQRAFMILTTNRWIANEEVAAAVNKHFAKEREELKRNPLFKLEIKK